MSAAGGVPASGANWPGPLLRSTADAPGRLAIRSTAPLLSRSAATRRVLPAAAWAWTTAVRVHARSPRVSTAIDPSTSSVTRSKVVSPVASTATMAPTGPAWGTASAWKAPPRRFSCTWTRPASSRNAASGTPSPSKSAQAKPLTPGTPANGCCTAKVPSPLLRSSDGCDGQRRRRQHDVEIAIGVGVGGPHGAGRCAGDRRRQRRGLRDVGEAAVRPLAQERDAGARGDDEVGAEVVVEIRRQHRVGTERRPRPCRAARRSAARRSARRSAPASATARAPPRRSRRSRRPRVASAAVPTVGVAENWSAVSGARRARLGVRQDDELLDRLADRVAAASRPARGRGGRPARARGRSSGTGRGSRRRAGWSTAAWRSASSCACAGAGHDGATLRQHVEALVHRGGVAALGGEADRVEARRQVVGWCASSVSSARCASASLSGVPCRSISCASA